MDSNLQLIKSITISCQIISLDANEENIYCLANKPICKSMIFDHQLNNCKNIGQSSNKKQAFYMTNQMTQIAYRDNKFYCLYPKRIDILNESTGILFKMISIQGNKMAFDSQSNLFVLSVILSKIFKYDEDGLLKEQIKVKNISSRSKFLINEDDKIVITFQ